MEKYIEYTKVFKALGDPKRAMIVDMLSCGELCACMILDKFEMSQSTLSHHMKILCESEIIKSRFEGKWTYYSLNEEQIIKSINFFSTITSKKINCICNDDINNCNKCNKV